MTINKDGLKSLYDDIISGADDFLKIKLVLSHFKRVSWSAYELFSQYTHTHTCIYYNNYCHEEMDLTTFLKSWM